MLDALLMADLADELRRLGAEPDPGPFSPAEYADNAAAGADWEAQQGVRKALRHLEAGRPADAVDILDRLTGRLPDGPARVRVADLAARLRAAAGPATGGPPSQSGPLGEHT